MIQLVKIFIISSFIIFHPITIEAIVDVNVWLDKETGLPCSVDIDYTKCHRSENNKTALIKSSNTEDNSIEQNWMETIQ